MAVTGHIRIGNQTAFSASSITAPFRYAVVNGFDAFEWFPDKKESGEGWSEQDIGKKTRAFIRQLALDHDIILSVHAPWHANPLEREAYEVLFRNIKFAQDLGASLLNIHLSAEQGIDAYIKAITPLMKHLGKRNIRLSIENTPTTEPKDFNKLFEQLQNDCPEDTAHVGMCLDPGHANLCKKTLNDYLKFIDLLDPKIPIIHAHMHENHGDYDSHLPLFTGPAGNDPSGIRGILDRLSKRGFSGAIILEQWPQPPSLLDEARGTLIEMLNRS
ncbi:MAG: sugar phosphate isomerase/epimerase [Deltaproteobacteria bacterium]|nr:sugar phosphate isomerase/epimerase [Deltaproteobacteria bacterium]